MAPDWRLAVLIVALVVVPGVVPDGATGGLRPETAAPSAKPAKSIRGRHVRPPRAC